jgi:VWFA-related protein
VTQRTMSMRFPLVLILSILPAWSQNQPAAPSPEITFSSRVNLVSVPVVVRDGRGHAVANLKQQDFQLFDKGKLQAITKFSVEKTAAVSSALSGTTAPGAPSSTADPGVKSQPIRPDRYVAWLFDDVHLSFSDVARTRDAAVRTLKEPFDPGTRAAIFTTSGRVSLDFTGDRNKLAQAIEQIRPLPTTDSGPTDCPGIGYYQADRILGQGDREAETAAEVGYVINCVHPGIAARDFASAMQEAHWAVNRALTSRALSLGKQATNANLGVLKELIRRMATLPGTRSIVLVSPGFFLTDDHHDSEADVTERAIRANVVVSSINTRGVAPASLGAVNAPPGLLEMKQAFDRRQASADEAIMENLADATGGTLFRNDNDYSEGFRRSAALPEYIYVLGFAPQNPAPDGSFHDLKVTLRSQAGLQVQARRGYWASSQAAGVSDAAKEEIEEAVFSRDEVHDLPVELVAGIAKKGDGNSELSIVAHVDLKGLHFQKADGRNNDTLTVIDAVFDWDGKYVTGAQKTINLKLTDETLGAFAKQRLTVETNLDVARGAYIVRLVVKDSEGQVRSAQNTAVEIP